jgi:hypothetical protein
VQKIIKRSTRNCNRMDIIQDLTVKLCVTLEKATTDTPTIFFLQKLK